MLCSMSFFQKKKVYTLLLLNIISTFHNFANAKDVDFEWIKNGR